MPLLSGFGPWWFVWVWSHLLPPNPEWSPLCFPPNTHSNHCDDTPFQQLCSRPYEMGQWKSLHLQNHHHDASAFLCYSHDSPQHLLLPDSLSLWGVLRPHPSALTWCLYYQAGLLGCEAVLSSMALMQANNIPGQKRMTSPLGQGHRASPESQQTHSQHSHNHHGHQANHGQAHHSHMGHASTGSCPPLVRERLNKVTYIVINCYTPGSEWPQVITVCQKPVMKLLCIAHNN